MRRKLLILSAALTLLLLLAIAAGVASFFTPLFTRYIESNGFRAAMEDETAKGLHFPDAHYAPIRRTSALTAQSESFGADNGVKAMKSLDARGITAKFDPWGVFSRQWRFDEVHVQSGEVEIQIYEAHPEATTERPWFTAFLPNRVYLKRIESDQAAITWRLRGEQAGLLRTRLLITPHGPDFEYRATGGILKMPLLLSFRSQDGRSPEVPARALGGVAELRPPLGAGFIARFLVSCFQHANPLLDVWQANRQGQPFALAALDRKFATVFAHNAPYNQ